MGLMGITMEMNIHTVTSDTLPVTPVTTTNDPTPITALRIYDDVIADIDAYTAAVRALSFGSVRVNAAQTFHGIAECTDSELAEWVMAHFPHATPTLTFFRHSPEGQLEPNYI